MYTYYNNIHEKQPNHPMSTVNTFIVILIYNILRNRLISVVTCIYGRRFMSFESTPRKAKAAEQQGVVLSRSTSSSQKPIVVEDQLYNKCTHNT